MAGLYWLIGWIILYWLDRIILAGSYSIGWIVSGNTGFYSLAGYLIDGMDGLDGTLVGWGWDGPTLAGAETVAPPLTFEGRRDVGSGGWNQLRQCFKGTESFFRSSKIIQIDCTKIRTNM